MIRFGVLRGGRIAVAVVVADAELGSRMAGVAGVDMGAEWGEEPAWIPQTRMYY